jgi:hypothetical protein
LEEGLFAAGGEGYAQQKDPSPRLRFCTCNHGTNIGQK